MGKSYLLISGKGGVGKSTLAAALAVTAARQGSRVALVDGDIGLRSLDLLLHLQDKVLYDLKDLVEHRCTLDQALIWHDEFKNLCLIVGGQQAKPKDFQKKDLQKVVRTLTRRFDLVLVDGPAGLGRGVNNFTNIVDEVLLVLTPDPVSIRSAEKLANQLYAAGLRPSMILNRVNKELVYSGAVPQPNVIASSLDLPLLGVIEESPLIYQALLNGKTAAQTEDENITASFEALLRAVNGDLEPVPDFKKTHKSLFQRFRDWLKD